MTSLDSYKQVIESLKTERAELLELINFLERFSGIRPNKPAEKEHDNEVHSCAVALGRLGGLRGGPARAKVLSKKRRKEISRKALKARWER